MKGDRVFKSLYPEWEGSGFNPLMQPQVRRVGFKGPMTVRDFIWKRKKEIDDEKADKENLLRQYVEHLIKQRKDHLEADIFNDIQQNGARFSGRKFNRTRVINEFQSEVAKRMQSGHLLEHQGYLYPKN